MQPAACADAAPAFPDAVAPERARTVASGDLELRVHEWGDPQAPPLLLLHGMFDHGRGFDRLAPLLARRFRVLALDARGHGDSQWADAYSWPMDLADIARALEWIGRPTHLVGHSKGGGQATDVATHRPDLVRRVVNIDGFGPPPEGFQRPGRALDSRPAAERFGEHLDRRRALSRREGWRAYPDLDALVERRRAQNPRLSREWLRYFVFHGARRDERGWRWKVDPLAGEGFGPWKAEWIAPLWRRLRVPLLAVTGTEPDTWGPLPEPVLAGRLAEIAMLERAVIPGAGHFVAMERPAELADALLGFLES
jgi:pimeloyl-ACP methyl ester carboxylesterase